MKPVNTVVIRTALVTVTSLNYDTIMASTTGTICVLIISVVRLISFLPVTLVFCTDHQI